MSDTSITVICHAWSLTVLYSETDCTLDICTGIYIYIKLITLLNFKMTVYNYFLFLVSYCTESFLFTFLLVRMDNLNFFLLSFFSLIITLLSDTDISFGLFNLFTYFDMPFG
jgi:hypothetical protein